MRALALSLLLVPAALAAQTPADAQLCDRIGDARHPDARARVQQAAQGGTPQAVFMQGCLALADAQWERAGDLFERAAKANDASAVAHYFVGRAYGAQAQRANVFKQASLARKTKQEFDRAVQLDPGYLDAREGLMQYYMLAPGIMGGSMAKAREQAQEIRRRDPMRGGFALAALAAREKNVGAAAREYEQLVAQYPDSARPYLALATLHVQQKQWDQAFATAERMLKAQPEAPVAHYVLGRVAAESGQQLERGEQALRRYIAAARPRAGEPPLANAHWRLGTILEKQGRRDQARAEYQVAVGLDGQLKPAREALERVR